MAPAHPPRRILCIKLKHIGDVLLMTPAVRAMRRAWPGSAIAALVPRGTEEILAGNPDLDGVMVFDRGGGSAGNWWTIRALRRYAPDLVLEMGQGDREAILGWLSGAPTRVGYLPGRSGGWRRALLSRAVPWNGQQHVVETNLDLVRACGIPAGIGQPVLVVQSEARARVTACLGSAGVRPGEPLVVVHPVARWLFKCWTDQGMAGLLRHLVLRRGLRVAVTAGPLAREAAKARAIIAAAGVSVLDLIGQTTLADMAAVLEQAQLFIGVDSAPMHMAAALGVPVVALFGPSGEESWGPWGPGHVVVAQNFFCRPCGRDGCLGTKRSDCLELLPLEAVVAAVDAQLARVIPRGREEFAIACAENQDRGASAPLGPPGGAERQH